MSYIIVTRVNGDGHAVVVNDGRPPDPDRPAEFATEQAASDAAAEVPVCRAWGYQVIEID